MSLLQEFIKNSDSDSDSDSASSKWPIFDVGLTYIVHKAQGTNHRLFLHVPALAVMLSPTTKPSIALDFLKLSLILLTV